MIDQYAFYAGVFGIISSAWLLYVSIKIYLTWKLKGALILAIGGLIASFTLLISPLPKMLFLIGEVIFFIGLTIGATLEYEKSRELNETAKLKDFLLGNIPKYESNEKIRPCRTPNLWIDLGVIALSAILYFYAGIKIKELLFIMIMSSIIIIYHLSIRLKNRKRAPC